MAKVEKRHQEAAKEAARLSVIMPDHIAQALADAEEREARRMTGRLPEWADDLVLEDGLDPSGLWAYERCKSTKCRGRRVNIGFEVSDESWLAVTGQKEGVLCLTCFDEMAQAKGVGYEILAIHPVRWNDTDLAEAEVGNRRGERKMSKQSIAKKLRRLQAHVEAGGANDDLTHATILCSELREDLKCIDRDHEATEWLESMAEIGLFPKITHRDALFRVELKLEEGDDGWCKILRVQSAGLSTAIIAAKDGWDEWKQERTQDDPR